MIFFIFAGYIVIFVRRPAYLCPSIFQFLYAHFEKSCHIMAWRCPSLNSLLDISVIFYRNEY